MLSFIQSHAQNEQFQLPRDSDVSAPYEHGTDNVERDDTYYFDDVIFLVENRLFKVPRHLFQDESEVFRDMFQLPIPKDGIVDGSSDQNPLRLEGIKRNEFGSLLRVMLPGRFRQEGTLSRDEWTSVLKLSSMWGLERVKEWAIEKMSQLTEIDDVTKIILANTYDIPSWLAPAITSLAQREKGLSVEEGNRLGMDWVLKIGEVRESAIVSSPRRWLENGCWCSCEDRVAVEKEHKPDVDYDNRIRAVFGFA